MMMMMMRMMLHLLLCSAPRGSSPYTEVDSPAFSKQHSYAEIPQRTSGHSYEDVHVNQQSSGLTETDLGMQENPMYNERLKKTNVGHTSPAMAKQMKKKQPRGAENPLYERKLQLSAADEKQRHSKSAESPLYESSVKDTADDLQPNSLYNQKMGLLNSDTAQRRPGLANHRRTEGYSYVETSLPDRTDA